MIRLTTPISEEAAAALQVGDTVEISGYILCGRDAVLPKVLRMIADGEAGKLGVDLRGQVIFHTAVSPAGVGPTSSNKLEIESSIAPLSAAGIKLHLGKGALHPETVAALRRRLDAIDIDGLTAAGHLEQYLTDRPRSPLPQLLHTERPDTFAAELD